jgi:hypothetical protein
MTRNRRNIYLYLTLLCFLSLIAVFVFDGYMGRYDTIRIDTGEFTQEIAPDYWRQGRSEFASVGVTGGDKATFRYEIANRRFITYQTALEVSVWRNQEKVTEILSAPVEISPFQSQEITWEVDSAALVPAETPPEQRYNYTVLIRTGDIERRVVLHINYPVTPVPPVRAG